MFTIPSLPLFSCNKSRRTNWWLEHPCRWVMPWSTTQGLWISSVTWFDVPNNLLKIQERCQVYSARISKWVPVILEELRSCRWIFPCWRVWEVELFQLFIFFDSAIRHAVSTLDRRVVLCCACDPHATPQVMMKLEGLAFVVRLVVGFILDVPFRMYSSQNVQ